MGVAELSSMGSVAVLTCVLGRVFLHQRRPKQSDDVSGLAGDSEFWTRHYRMSEILRQVGTHLPDRLRLPNSLVDPNVVFMSMALHTSTVCLHQVAIQQADRHSLPTNIGYELRVRYLSTAAEIATIMRMLSHLDLSNVSRIRPSCAMR